MIHTSFVNTCLQTQGKGKMLQDPQLNGAHKPDIYTLEKQRLKITQLENVRFIKVNELKLT